MPNIPIPAAGRAMPALCRIFRLRLALLLLRTANKLSYRAKRIIDGYEEGP
ncbi:hypothetical protein [Mesorhizobium caraganae]|uniref:hypothetical protein n=1 Tax=Mesorhizobium caraganae TaxID=483206 RepID=UPI003ED07ED9